MMTEQETLYKMAETCAYLRCSKVCKNHFGDQICAQCDSYIANYSNASMKDLKLFMYSAECQASNKWATIQADKYYMKKVNFRTHPVVEAASDVGNFMLDGFTMLVKIAIVVGVIGLAWYLWSHK